MPNARVYTDQELLRACTLYYGSVTALSEAILRERRTVHRWLANDSPLPKKIRDHCAEIMYSLPEAVRFDLLDKAREMIVEKEEDHADSSRKTH